MENIEHFALSWSALDIISYMECMQGYEELPLEKVNDEFFESIMQDVLNQYSDAIIEKINFYISEHLSDNRAEIIKQIKQQL